MRWPGTRRRAAMPSALDPDLAGLTYPNTIQWWLDTGAWASPTLAMKVGTVVRCLQLVSQQIARLPLRFRGTDEPLWVSNPDPVWYPGGIGSAIFAAVYGMYGWGDAFLWVTSRYADGYPQAWTVIDPRLVTVEADPRGGRLYRVNNDYLRTEDILQISRDPNGGLRGSSALQGYGGNIASAAAAESYSTETLAAGGVPWGVLQVPGRPSSEQADKLKAEWLSKSAGRGGAPAVMSKDILLTEFSYNPKDMALVETREWDAKQIAAAFGVPAFMLNMEQAGGLNYSNPEMLFDTWWKTELSPAAHRIAEHLSTWTPRGSWVEFDPSGLLAPDVSGRQAIASKAFADGALTLNEYRAYVFDLPPLEEGEALELIDEPPGAKPSAGQTPVAVPALEVVAQ